MKLLGLQHDGGLLVEAGRVASSSWPYLASYLQGPVYSLRLSSPSHHRRRIKSKAKVVAAVCGSEFIQFLAAQAILHWDDFEE